MTIIRRIKAKLRYSSPIRLLFDGLHRLGFRFSFMILFLERVKDDYELPALVLKDEIEVGYWDKEQIKAIDRVEGRSRTFEQMARFLDKGARCLGIRVNGKPAAFTWYRTYRGALLKKHLENNEAYMFDAYTLMDYRGKGIMPYLRAKMLMDLQSQGFDKLYSYSDYFNRPAVRFKEKIDSKRVNLIGGLIIGKRKKYIVLKKYAE